MVFWCRHDVVSSISHWLKYRTDTTVISGGMGKHTIFVCVRVCVYTHIYKVCVNVYLQQKKDQLCEEYETFYLLLVQVSWVRRHVCTCQLWYGIWGLEGCADWDEQIEDGDCLWEETVVVAGVASLMHQNCLPKDKMSNRCLYGWKGPAAISVLPFSLLCHQSLQVFDEGWVATH